MTPRQDDQPAPRSLRRWLIGATIAMTLSGGLGASMGGLKALALAIDRAKAYYEILESIRQRREEIADEAIRERMNRRGRDDERTRPNGASD